jgi:hypothetical protein
VTAALRAALEAESAARPTSAVEARVRRQHASVVKRVVAMLEAPRHRGPARRIGEATVHLAVGLGAIHEAMGARGARHGRARFEISGERPPPRSRNRGAAAPREQQDEDPDTIEMIDPLSGATVAVAGERRRARGDEPEADEDEALGRAFGVDEWQVADRGPRGIGIARRGRPAALVGVGEPVAFRSGNGSWVVGVVRWLAVDTEEVHRAGIEVLSPAALPVEVRAEDDGRDGAVRAALVLKAPDGSPSATMVAFPGTHASGRVLIATSDDGKTAARLRAGRLLEATAACEVFEVQELRSSAAPAASSTPG